MSKFENVEDARKFLNDLENNLKQFEDEHYNLSEEINKGKQEIKAMENLCDELKSNNYQLWSQSSIMENEVQEIEENQPTIEDIIGGIDIKWQSKIW